MPNDENDEEYSNFVKTLSVKKQIEIDEQKLIVNPFTQELLIEVTKRIDNGTYIVDNEGIMVPASSLVEKTKYTKVFQSKEKKERVYALSPGAKSLYLFILYELQPGKDWIRIRAEWYMKKNEIKSRNTYKAAITELGRYGFVSRTMDYDDVYWINPSLFFNGSRINKYPKNIEIKNEWEVSTKIKED